jgi:ribose transport system ATP-binding protein
MTQLSLRGIRKSYSGVEVLHGVDLDATSGRVLAILGENGAGKTTLTKIVAGATTRDAGDVLLDGKVLDIRSPRDAWEAGVRMVYQEFADAPTLTVAENILLGHLPHRYGLVRWPQLRRRAAEVLASLGVELELDAINENLSAGRRQIVEVARGLATEGRVFIFDEPTSALGPDEVNRLFRLIRNLKERDTIVLYITHRLHEVFELADDVLVLRDGFVTARGPISEFTRHDLIVAQVGEESAAAVEAQAGAVSSIQAPSSIPVLRVHEATIVGLFRDVELVARSGEIVAVFGKLGSGAQEFCESLFGLRSLDLGEVLLGDRRVRLTSPVQAIELGIGFVPADRKRDAVFPILSVARNIAAANWAGIAGPMGFLDAAKERAMFERWKEILHIVAPEGPEQEMQTLSGGTQQKAVLARWLQKGCKILVLVEPTRGVDVAARSEIHRTLRTIAASGGTVIFASSDVDEVLRVADRILVFRNGRLVGEFRPQAVDAVALMHAAA